LIFFFFPLISVTSFWSMAVKKFFRHPEPTKSITCNSELPLQLSIRFAHSFFHPFFRAPSYRGNAAGVSGGIIFDFSWTWLSCLRWTADAQWKRDSRADICAWSHCGYVSRFGNDDSSWRGACTGREKKTNNRQGALECFCISRIAVSSPPACRVDYQTFRIIFGLIYY